MNELIDLNSAGVEELQTLPGIGPKLAARIVAYRDEHGPFHSVADLAEVPGVSPTLAAELAPLVTVGEPAAALPSLIVQVTLQGAAAGQTYHGHRVTAAFTRRQIVVNAAGQTDSLWVPGQTTNHVSDDGQTVLELPNRDDLRDSVEFSVHAPDGTVLLRQTVAVASVDESMSFAVAPQTYATTQPTADPAFGRPSRLRGRVIDRAGQRQAAGVQVVIWGAQREEPAAADFRALLVVLTDAAGYFSGPYPLGEFTAAFGAVSVEEEPVDVPIHLEDGGFFPESVILVVDMPERIEGEECGCDGGAGEVQRAPDAIDLARADGSFTSDPRAGRCVDFTKPDRTLEEFNYAYVVRTTEPEIKGLVLEEPSKIDLATVLQYVPETAVATFQRDAMRVAAVQPGGAFAPATAMVAPAVAAAVLAGAAQPLPPAPAAVAAAGQPPPGQPAGQPAAEPQLLTAQLDARILRTLARDPDGFSLTQVAAASRLSLHGDLMRLLGRYVARQSGRTRMTCENAVDWDDEPTIYQACTIAHGHVLRFKQEWVADGYSMGNLLYSLPLAPGQKKQIAIVDWERRESASRTEAQIVTEELESELSRNRDIIDVVSGAVSESLRGGSSSSAGSFGGGLGIGAILGPVGALLGIGGGTSSASSSAWQNSSRSTSANALNQLRDRTSQSASAVRSQRSTVIQTVRQGERAIATTETVANYNHCHALTIQYFEVLRHLLVRQRLTDVQECLFVPLLMSRFNQDKALRWRNTLAGAVRSRQLRAGFDAMERIANHYDGSDLPVGTYADQSLDYLDGDLSIRFQLARPRDNNDTYDPAAWNWINLLLPFISPQDFYNQFLRDQALKDRIFLEQLGPQIAENFVQYLQFTAVLNDNTVVNLPVDATLLSSFANNQPMHLSLRLAANLPPLRRKDIKFISISGRVGLPFTLINLLPAGSKVIIDSGNMRYRTKYSSDYLFRDARIQNDVVGGDAARIFTPLNRQEQRNPREEDKELARNLLDHLNEHIEHYHHVIWRFMSPDRRYMLLDGFEAPNSGGRSVASVVENVLIGIVGNSLILPVARGFHLDPTYNQDVENPIDLLEHYQPNTPIEPIRVAIPTKGVYAEAVMGACNSCEFKEEARFWRWEESPIPDSPAAILPVSTDTRRTDPGNLQVKDLPAPIIAMQSAPAAPDPVGLGAALQLLGTPNLFRDVAGLEGTQRNAAAALQGALDTAQFFGGKAADLALQARMSRDGSQVMRTIRDARQQGLINDQQASQLTEGAIRTMMGGGQNAPSQPMTTNDVQQLVDQAGQNRAAVNVARPGGERVEVDARPAPGAEDSAARPIILVDPTSNSPDNRAFRPASRDLSGVIDLEASFRNAPAGSTLRWSSIDPAGVAIDNPDSPRTRVRAMRPGRTTVDVVLRDSGGVQLASAKLNLSVPQFVRVTEDAAAFDGVLNAIHLDTLKNEVITRAREVCDHLLRTSNVRTVWQVGSFNDALPAHLPANHVTVATFRGEPPAATPNRLGQTNPVGGTGGAAVLNETIDIFPGAYDNPVAGATTIDVDVETQALIVQLESQTFTDPALEQLAINVYGRLLGETLAHEIVHSLLWTDVAPGFHNTPAVPNDLMNGGADRTFRQRTGFEDTAHTSPVDPANFVDHGIAAIGGLQATNQGLMNNRFPTPPAFG